MPSASDVHHRENVATDGPSVAPSVTITPRPAVTAGAMTTAKRKNRANTLGSPSDDTPVSEGRRARAAIRTSTLLATENPVAVARLLPVKLFTVTLTTKHAARIHGHSALDRSSSIPASRPLESQIAATPGSSVRAMLSQAVAA